MREKKNEKECRDKRGDKKMEKEGGEVEKKNLEDHEVLRT